MGIIWTLLVGALAGWLAAKLMGVNEGNWGKNIILGLAGSLLGSLVAWIIGLSATNIIGSCLIAVAGSCLVVYLYKRFAK